MDMAVAMQLPARVEAHGLDQRDTRRNLHIVVRADEDNVDKGWVN